VSSTNAVMAAGVQPQQPAWPMPVRLHYQIELGYDVRTAGADFVFNIQAAHTPHQRVVNESVLVSQPVPTQEYTDPINAARWLRLRANAGPLHISYAATVDVWHYRADPTTIPETWLPNLPGATLPFLYPSRFCHSDELSSLARAEFGALWQGYTRVQWICDWVRQRIAFTSGTSGATTTASHTLAQGEGVCRDFAHVMIALCRALNVPARFTTGLDYGADPALGPPDFHAYVEAFLGDRWYLFDPSGTAIPMGFVRLTSGRDAAECAYASIFGDVVPTGRRLHIEAVPGVDGVLRLPYRCADALSTAQV
jgi:transglutaminase-like putative cysteine protease